MLFFDESRERKAIGQDERKAVHARQKSKCMYCGRKLALADGQIDHKRAHSKGGSDKLSNLQFTCSSCNSRKGKMTDGLFRKAYAAAGLLPALKANGKPPSKPISIKKMDEVSKSIKAKKTKARTKARGKRDDWEW